MTGRRRAVFLDRDGVLNEPIIRDARPYSPSGLHEVVIPADVPDALRALRGAGFLLIMVTNQPDVARGRQTRSRVEEINAWLQTRLPLDDIFVCYHDDRDGCSCRKPQPGLLLQAAAAHGIDVSQSFMIGDRWRDDEAGRRAGCRTVRIDRRYKEEESGRPPDYIVHSFSDAAAWILQHSRTRGGVR